MNDTDALPFVLVHGEWLWKVVLALFVALMLATFWGLRRVRQNLSWKTEMQRFARGRAPATVRGVLRGGSGELVQSLHAEALQTHPNIVLDFRAEALHLETEDGRKVELVGEVRAAGGSRAAACGSGVPDELSEAALEQAREKAPWLHRRRFGGPEVREATVLSLVDGDRVRAYGVLERGPGSDESDFRNAGVAWSLRGDEGPILLMAERPVVPRRRLSWIATGLLAAAVSFTGYQIEKKLGSRWRAQCALQDAALRDASSHQTELLLERPLVVGNGHACVLATAGPARRDYALETFLDVLEDHPYRDEASLRRMNQLTRLTEGGCKKVIERLHDLGRYEDVRREAAQCGDRRAEHEALVALARYAEAAALPVPANAEGERALPEVETLLAAGLWNEAAPRVAARAEEIGRRQPDEDASAESIGLTARHYQCLAELLRHHGGDAGAAARIRQLRGQPYGVSCAPMIIELDGPLDPKHPELEVDPDATRLLETSSLLRSYAYSAGVPDRWRAMPPFGPPEELLAHPNDAAISPNWELWMFNGELAELPQERRSLILRWRAAHRVLVGDIEGARAMAKEAIAIAPPPGDELVAYEMRDLRHLLPSIALYTPDTQIGADLSEPPGELGYSPRRGWLHDFGRLLLRDGQPIAGAYFGPDDELPDLLTLAQKGDGRPLARYMSGGRYRTRWWNTSDVLAVLPRITIGREQVAKRLLWSRPMTYIYFNSVTSIALNAFARREVMKAAGLTEAAEAWGAIVRRADEVLGDRKRLMALRFYKL